VLPTVTTAATFCATLVDEWVRAGVAEAVVAPGSRSTPLALALAADGRMRLTVCHDERVAGFVGLGVALATGRPAVVVCTSGTAAAHLHAAVIETGLSSVPMIVCTADRPPELWDVGAAQTVDQTHLYGRSVRFFAEPGVPDDATAGTWRSLAARAVLEATAAVPSAVRPGPVHLNLSFRDPLAGSPGPLPEGRVDGTGWHGPVRAPRAGVPDVATVLAAIGVARRGLIVAGHGVSDPDAVLELGHRWGWPVLADPRSGCRTGSHPSVAHGDAILRAPGVSEALRPEVVLRFGELPASKVVGQWLAGAGAVHVVATSAARWNDPDRLAALLVPERGLAVALAEVDRGVEAAWADAWHRAESIAADVLGFELSVGPLSEPAIARAVSSAMPSGGHLVVSSSMPVRDLEWFGAPRADVVVHANRGANGIDGVVSTAIGVAIASGAPTACLIGDVAFLHDASALTALAGRAVDLRIVVVDNDGGGIFSFLPQAELVEAGHFEALFGTPHGTDLVALAQAHGLAARSLVTAADVTAFVADGTGVRVGVVRTGSRSENVAEHRRLNAAVVDALLP
jgi:2-succinyl-5-enolpyruvyl-6-hydroxy-3-cyclohexene-1-carboxylate synthase